MTNIISTLTSFGLGIAATIVTFSVYAEVHAQDDPPKTVDVCADAAGTLRLTEVAAPCRPGERRLRIRQPDLQKPNDQQAQNDARIDDLRTRVKALEKRAAEGKLLKNRVFAPFEVVNEDGYVIFRVENEYVWFYNSKNKAVARIVADDDGGFLETRSLTDNLQAVLGVRGNRANLFIQHHDNSRVVLGSDETGGRYGLRVLQPDGKVVASIGQNQDGDGQAFVADAGGTPRAAFTVLRNGGGSLEIKNKGGTTVANLLASEMGNGRLTLFNQAGATMVEAGVNAENVGVVRTGPSAFGPGGSFVTGFPASYIIGKAAK